MVISRLFLIFLTYLFHSRIVLEGLWGYVVAILILTPANLLLPYLDIWEGHLAGNPAVLYGALFLFNCCFLFLWVRALPGLAVSSWGAVALFCLFFAGIPSLLYFVPTLRVPWIDLPF